MMLRVAPVEILLVEDNPGDILLMQEVLADCKIRNNLSVARDGEEAMMRLRNGRFHPNLVLLDLNLPKKDGREVLAEIKSDPLLKSIPVIVLTTSSSEDEVLRSYQLHANCFLSKPVQLDDFIQVIRSIENFWLMIVNLPSVSVED